MWLYLKHSFLVNAVLLLFGMFLVYHTAISAKDAIRVRRETHDTQKRIQELTHKKEELEKYLAELETVQTIEREAKERLNVKRIGEEVVVVVPEQKKSERIEEIRPVTFWESLKRRISNFFNRFRFKK